MATPPLNMGATARRNERKATLRTQILDVAREMFVKKGYEGFSMRALAQTIRYSPGTIYLHFSGKDELFEWLVSESFARLEKTLAALRHDSASREPIAQLVRGMQLYVSFGQRNPNHYRFAFLLWRPRLGVPHKVHPTFDVMRSLVLRCIEDGQFPGADVELASQALWAAVHGVVALLIQRPTFPWVNKAKLIDQVIRNAVDGLAASCRLPRSVGVRRER
jgi:AcrR family transcriptional regulator